MDGESGQVCALAQKSFKPGTMLISMVPDLKDLSGGRAMGRDL